MNCLPRGEEGGGEGVAYNIGDLVRQTFKINTELMHQYINIKTYIVREVRDNNVYDAYCIEEDAFGLFKDHNISDANGSVVTEKLA